MVIIPDSSYNGTVDDIMMHDSSKLALSRLGVGYILCHFDFFFFVNTDAYICIVINTAQNVSEWTEFWHQWRLY